MPIADLVSDLRARLTPDVRPLRRVDLTLPALCRDALDRVVPIGNFLWLLAALAFAGWTAIFVYFTLSVIVETGNLFGFVEELWFQAVVLTGLAGGFLWSRDAMRFVTGAALVWLAGFMGFAFLIDLARAIVLTLFEGQPWPFGTTPMMILLLPLILSLLLLLLFAGIGLLLYGRRGFWRAFADESRDTRWTDGILHGLGVAQEGFFSRRGARALMLVGKALLAIGLVVALPGYLLLAVALFPIAPAPADAQTGEQYRVAGALMIGFTAFGLAASAAIGMLFRRLFPPQRLREQEDCGERPIFLRSFRDDSVRLRNAWPLAPLPLPPDVPRNLDEIILARFPDAVAFGRPGEERAPFGVPRRYVDEAQWRDRVSEVLDRSALLLVCIDETPGLEWEVQELLARGYARKTKFLMHPKLSNERKRELGRAFAVALPERDLRRLRGMDSAASGEVRVYLGAANGATYRCMLGWMIAR